MILRNYPFVPFLVIGRFFDLPLRLGPLVHNQAAPVPLQQRSRPSRRAHPVHLALFDLELIIPLKLLREGVVLPELLLHELVGLSEGVVGLLLFAQKFLLDAEVVEANCEQFDLF